MADTRNATYIVTVVDVNIQAVWQLVVRSLFSFNISRLYQRPLDDLFVSHFKAIIQLYFNLLLPLQLGNIKHCFL